MYVNLYRNLNESINITIISRKLNINLYSYKISSPHFSRIVNMIGINVYIFELTEDNLMYVNSYDKSGQFFFAKYDDSMTVDDMIQARKNLGYSYKQISELSGVPIGTVQKVLGKITTSPRHSTITAISKAFKDSDFSYDLTPRTSDQVMEAGSVYLETMDAPRITSYKNKTLEDYLALPEGTRIELIDGEFYDMAAPTVVHQRIGAMIFNVFENFINENGGPCIASVAPTDVQLDCDDKTVVQPDVLVVCDRDKIIKARVVGAPDLIIEVMSPSNWTTDMVKKLRKYRKANVREYWIVLPDNKSVLCYFFEEDEDPIEYTFDDKVPVNIWNRKCVVDFKDIYNKISFLYDD